MRTKNGSVHNAQAGFTLIEILVVVVIVGILAAVAYPSYQESVFRARRTDGKDALLGIQLAQEKFRSNCPIYANNIGAPPSGNPACNPGGASYLGYRTTSEDGYYALAIVAGSVSATGYALTATPQGLQADDRCATFRVNQDGKDTSVGFADIQCWDH